MQLTIRMRYVIRDIRRLVIIAAANVCGVVLNAVYIVYHEGQ